MRRVPRRPRIVLRSISALSTRSNLSRFEPYDETKRGPSALFGCRNPSYSLGVLLRRDGSPVPRVSHQGASESDLDPRGCAPPRRGGPMNSEALCHVRRKPAVFPILHLVRSIRT